MRVRQEGDWQEQVRKRGLILIREMCNLIKGIFFFLVLEAIIKSSLASSQKMHK